MHALPLPPTGLSNTWKWASTSEECGAAGYFLDQVYKKQPSLLFQLGRHHTIFKDCVPTYLSDDLFFLAFSHGYGAYVWKYQRVLLTKDTWLFPYVMALSRPMGRFGDHKKLIASIEEAIACLSTVPLNHLRKIDPTAHVPWKSIPKPKWPNALCDLVTALYYDAVLENEESLPADYTVLLDMEIHSSLYQTGQAPRVHCLDKSTISKNVPALRASLDAVNTKINAVAAQHPSLFWGQKYPAQNTWEVKDCKIAQSMMLFSLKIMTGDVATLSAHQRLAIHADAQGPFTLAPDA